MNRKQAIRNVRAALSRGPTFDELAARENPGLCPRCGQHYGFVANERGEVIWPAMCPGMATALLNASAVPQPSPKEGSAQVHSDRVSPQKGSKRP